MKIHYTYRPNEDEQYGTYYINRYVTNDAGQTSRDTVYDELTEDEALELSNILNRYTEKEYH